MRNSILSLISAAVAISMASASPAAAFVYNEGTTNMWVPPGSHETVTATGSVGDRAGSAGAAFTEPGTYHSKSYQEGAQKEPPIASSATSTRSSRAGGSRVSEPFTGRGSYDSESYQEGHSNEPPIAASR
jgi:hypothetical protein